MNDKDKLRLMLAEFETIRNWLVSSSCMRLPWSYEYNESDGIKEQMARFINLQCARRDARMVLVITLDEQIKIIKDALGIS